jgi:hypothetical protein
MGVPVTGISGVPTLAIVNEDLTLDGTVEPSNATNKTIVWSGSNVSNGVFRAPSAGIYTVTATVVNGVSEWTPYPYTQNFAIRAVDAGVGIATNPFGSDGTPFYWAMDDTGGTVYVRIWGFTWESRVDGALDKNGTYSWSTGTNIATWTVTGGGSIGNTGLAYIDPSDGGMTVANFANIFSDMNGTFTKLNTSLTFEGTWKTITAYHGDFSKIVAGNNGEFVVSVSDDGLSGWSEEVKGTYPASGDTNPAILTITHVKDHDNGGSWKPWENLTPEEQQDEYGGFNTYPVLVYSDRCESLGYVFLKQP